MSLNGSHRADVSVMTLVKLHNSPVVCRGYVCKHTCWKFYTPLYQHLSCSAWNQYIHIRIVPPPPKTNNCTFCVASSSRSLACSCCMRLNSSCCPWRRRSEALLPLGSTGEVSGFRSFQEPIMSRPENLLGREGLRTKSKLKAEKESEREARDLLNICAILILLSKSVTMQDTQRSTMSMAAAERWLTPVCVRSLLFSEVLGWSVHQLPLLCAAVAGVKHTPPVLASSPSQIRHGVPKREGDKLFFYTPVTPSHHVLATVNFTPSSHQILFDRVFLLSYLYRSTQE